MPTQEIMKKRRRPRLVKETNPPPRKNRVLLPPPRTSIGRLIFYSGRSWICIRSGPFLRRCSLRLDSTGRICRGYKQITISCIEDGTSPITQNFYSNKCEIFWNIFCVLIIFFFYIYLFQPELIYSFNLHRINFILM